MSVNLTDYLDARAKYGRENQEIDSLVKKLSTQQKLELFDQCTTDVQARNIMWKINAVCEEPGNEGFIDVVCKDKARMSRVVRGELFMWENTEDYDNVPRTIIRKLGFYQLFTLNEVLQLCRKVGLCADNEKLIRDHFIAFYGHMHNLGELYRYLLARNIEKSETIVKRLDEQIAGLLIQDKFALIDECKTNRDAYRVYYNLNDIDYNYIPHVFHNYIAQDKARIARVIRGYLSSPDGFDPRSLVDDDHEYFKAFTFAEVMSLCDEAKMKSVDKRDIASRFIDKYGAMHLI